jgi:hypothetical protein
MAMAEQFDTKALVDVWAATRHLDAIMTELERRGLMKQVIAPVAQKGHGDTVVEVKVYGRK